jgi:hypothetical protein
MLGLGVDCLDFVEFCKIQGSFGTHEGMGSSGFFHGLPLFDQNLLFFCLNIWYARVRSGLVGFC